MYIDTFRQFAQERTHRVESLRSDKHRLMFACSCCERQVGNYAAFQRTTGWGDIDLLVHALDALWSTIVLDLQIGCSEAEIYRSKIRELAPDDEEFSNAVTLQAHNATHFCSALDRSFAFVSERDAQFVSGVGDVAFNAVDEYVRAKRRTELEKSGIDLKTLPFAEFQLMTRRVDEAAWKDSLVQREVLKQIADLTRLGELVVISDGVVGGFREAATCNGLSNLDISRNGTGPY